MVDDTAVCIDIAARSSVLMSNRIKWRHVPRFTFVARYYTDLVWILDIFLTLLRI
jgi:hypothetical protein